MSQQIQKLKILSFSGESKILHMSWIAFFLTFFMWFNHAPLKDPIMASMDMQLSDWKTLLLLNVALTIPARIIVGILVDKYGPKLIFTGLLIFGSIPCFLFAIAEEYQQMALARFLLGGVGAGFVIGIRLISEWYPAKQTGVASGIYAGWGNFGSSAAAMTIPMIALFFGGENGWRYAIASTGVLALLFAFIFYKNIHDTPKGSTYFKPKKSGAMEVTSKKDLWFYILFNIPMYLALAVIALRLAPIGSEIFPKAVLGTPLLSNTAVYLICIGLLALYWLNVRKIFHVNIEHLKEPVPEIHQYKFKQVALLSLTYMVTFGSELAIISMLPSFFINTFDLSIAIGAAIAGAVFASFNLFARPLGGLLSDKIGRKKALSILLAGAAIGYFLMAQINSEWHIAMAILATMAASLFVHAGNGAVYAVVPLIRRSMTGQIAGMAGAYGNVGAVIFLIIFSVSTTPVFFMSLAGFAVALLLLIQFLDEPKGAIAEVLPDGTVQMIEVE
ncbi:Nitrate/nitrite transporter [hydrothermal vent metagenome]|uniref:Nitrate/nitrite transporter n=1 Tax=hydrothermal vent metagenome TaxID=652676 RepID=A0A3B1AIT0_9ZZZZ